jgi:hypothetical protein
VVKPYDDDCDFCGPSGNWTSKFISRYIFGVDMNIACYDHDKAYEKGGTEEDRRRADEQFRDDMYSCIKCQMSWWNPFRVAAYVWVRRRYDMVRLLGWKHFKYRED